MEYSITSLAKQARVTVRTLRHYDQVGLLKPSIRMENGKRIYGDEQFLRLFEIIFFKKIGMSLPKIKGVVLSKDYDKAAAMVSRKQELEKELTSSPS
jgi:DNA-binding transcriptional MerR regulator